LLDLEAAVARCSAGRSITVRPTPDIRTTPTGG
jgi:hypothetical protein